MKLLSLSPDKKILVVSAFILLLAALLGDLGGLTIFSRQSEKLLKNNLQQVLTVRQEALQLDIQRSVQEFNAILNNQFLQNNIRADSQKAYAALEDLFIAQGFSAVSLVHNNATLFSHGNFSANTYEIPLPFPYAAILIWDKQWLVKLTNTLPDNKTIVAEWPLQTINYLYRHAPDLGETGNFAICTEQAKNGLLCFPARNSQAPYKTTLTDIEKNVEDNKSKIYYNLPLPIMGLNLVGFISSKELYQPVYEQLKTVLPLFLFVITLGVLILYWQIAPLLRKIVSAEKNVLEQNALLKESESRFRSAFDFAAVGMALVSLEGKFLRVNPSLLDILGCSEETLLTKHFQDLVSNDNLIDCLAKLDSLKSKLVTHISMEQQLLAADGNYIWCLVTGSLVSGVEQKPLYFVVQIQNIEEKKIVENQLIEMAFHDGLTGLDNRTQIEKNIQNVLNHCQAAQTNFALIFLDLDHFKNVNDTLGHEAGDVLLKTIAERLRSAVRHTDRIGRLGGDEFIILIPHILNPQYVGVIAQKVLDALQAPMMLKGKEIVISTSIGISIYPKDGREIGVLLENADTALYRAKKLGKNNYQFYSSETSSSH